MGDKATGSSEIARTKKADRFLSFGKVALVLVCFLGTVAGWKIFYFFTDDAFIAFRYISNSMAGYGLTWNPPPFLPVEGYTSFLWVILLRGIWSLTGLEPPQVANILSLFFGLGTLFVTFQFIKKMRLPRFSEGMRLLSAAIVMAGIIGNRTFLAWLSSGLETSMNNFLLIWWLYLVFTAPSPDENRPGWVFFLSATSALLALSRPEGILIAVGTVGIAVVRRFQASRGARYNLWWYAPVLIVPAHLFWRRSYYGFWVPNTYYAKHAGPWPESGYHYFLSFVLEYGVWFWVGIFLIRLVRYLARGKRSRQADNPAVALRMIGLGAIGIQIFYYTFIIGGDHFEFRIFSFLIPLLFVSALALLSGSVMRPAIVLAALLCFVLVSFPVPWTHWAMTRHLRSREETFTLVQPVAGVFPAPLRPIVSLWDRSQEWLIRHMVCMRHPEHKGAWLFQLSQLPSRQEGSAIKWEERAILKADAVGYLGWVFPGVAIIDAMGLNDLVIARTDLSRKRREFRLMAHDRGPPRGYVECFRPNVLVRRDKDHLVFTPEPRSLPLTDEDIMRCESKYLFFLGVF